MSILCAVSATVYNSVKIYQCLPFLSWVKNTRVFRHLRRSAYVGPAAVCLQGTVSDTLYYRNGLKLMKPKAKHSMQYRINLRRKIATVIDRIIGLYFPSLIDFGSPRNMWCNRKMDQLNIKPRRERT